MDYVLDYMKKNEVPLTRDNYLNLAYMGETQKHDAEAEADMPKELSNDSHADSETTGNASAGVREDKSGE